MNKPYLLIINILLLITYSFYSSVSYSQNNTHKDTINILTWWGYLNQPEIINAAENKCGTKISFDQYYSNDEFLRRWRENKNSYDIVIFSNTIYDGVKSEIKNINTSNLWKQSNKYNPTIKNYYIKNKYPRNIVYFVHSLTGFMYNPEIIYITKDDSIFTMFKKANHRMVIIVDDSVEAQKLLKLGFNDTNYNDKYIFNSDNFKKLYQNANVFIGNGFNQIYKRPNFAFAFAWSGEGIKQIQESDIKLKFLIHPNLSYISSDLLAQTKEDKKAECVAAYLTSEETLKLIENSNYYFSSYANINNISNEVFRDIYTQFLNALPTLKWISSVGSEEFDSMNRLIQPRLHGHLAKGVKFLN